MRSPYMDILEAAGTEPKEFVLPSRYEAGVAATCVRSLGVSYGIKSLQIRLLGRTVFVWIGAAKKIVFMPPPFPKIGPRMRRGPKSVQPATVAGFQTSREANG